jgi:hypothetical protein
MKVTVVTDDGKELTYFITWQYFRKKKTVETHCYIFAEPAKMLISTGRTYVHKGDSFTKAEGRKWSLTKAVEQKFPGLKGNDPTSNDLSQETLDLNKKIRTAIWKAYSSMINNKF